MEQWSQPTGRAQVPGAASDAAPGNQASSAGPPGVGFAPPQQRPPMSGPVAPSASPPPAGAAPTVPLPPPGAPATPLTAVTSGFPTVTDPGRVPPGPAAPPGLPATAGPPWQPPGSPPAGSVRYGAPTTGVTPYPSPPPAAVPGRPRRGWPGVLALILVIVLVAAVAVQSWLLVGLSDRLDRANQQLSGLTQEQAYTGERLDALEDRAAELERKAGEVFDSEAIANAVLPSVFKVSAGDFTGTAFAVGGPSESGGTNLLTNYHVVQQVWERGGREVVLERTNQRYEAEIVDVEPDDDLAWLHTRHSFVGLAASRDEVRSGQPIIAVGAPLGLTDTVTTGVVSSPAQRLPDGTGPWIQFDAAINPGNSGGPVINAGQEVVGIATQKGRETEGLGFAVPITVACERFDVC